MNGIKAITYRYNIQYIVVPEISHDLICKLRPAECLERSMSYEEN